MSGSTTDTRRQRWIAPVLLAAVALAAAAAGAYLDWRWWQPYSGIVITMAAAAILVLAGIAALARVPVARAVAMTAGAVGIGLLLGQNLGPSREAPISSSGTIILRLDEPAAAADLSGRADCSLTASGDSLSITSDHMRLQIGQQELRDQGFIGMSVTKGDMWEAGAEARPDGLGVSFLVGRGGPIPEDGAPVVVMMASATSSELDGAIDERSGSIRFSGLVVDPRHETGGTSEAIELVGSVEWSCEGPPGLP